MIFMAFGFLRLGCVGVDVCLICGRFGLRGFGLLLALGEKFARASRVGVGVQRRARGRGGRLGRIGARRMGAVEDERRRGAAREQARRGDEEKEGVESGHGSWR